MSDKVNNKISNLLGGDHYRIGALLDKFTKYNSSKNYPKMSASFAILKKELKKHFNIEEEIIFKHIHPQDAKIYSFIPPLIKQHDLILEALSDVQDNLAINAHINLHNFIKQLSAHKEFEDQTFYPKLDQVLFVNQKKVIILKLKNKFKKEYKL